MAKVTITIFLALFLSIVSAKLQRLEFDQGRTNLRLLATTDAATPKYAFNQSRTLNTAVQVDLGTKYLTRAGIDKSTTTDMLLFLFTNVTGFCIDCSEFVKYSCDSNACGANFDQPMNMTSPFFSVTTGYPMTHNLNFGTDSSNWQLKTSAMYFTSSGRGSRRSISLPGSWNPYYVQEQTYGFVGLGISGDAVNNFQTGDHPIFSIQVNSTGKGQLVFGKDTTLYNQTRAPVILTSDPNWTLQTQNMTFGPAINSTSFISSLIFDLQYPGIGLPYDYYYYNSNIWSKFIKQYNLTANSSYGNNDYNYVYSGKLTDLPNLNFGLVGTVNLTLPPSAYTRKVANDTYAILISPVSTVTNLTSNKDVNYTVLGWPVLSQFYSVFELPKGSSNPTISLYPTYEILTVTPPPTGISTIVKIAAVAAAALVLAVALSCLCKKKPVHGNHKDLGVELRAATH